MSDHPQNIRNAMPGETTPISVRDSATGAVVPNVGDQANAAIRVNMVAGGGGGGNVNLTGINGVAPSVSNGTSDAGTLRVTLASNSTGQVVANAPALTSAPIDISANGQIVAIALANGNASLMLDIESIGNGGTIQAEVSADGGVTWSPITMTPVRNTLAPAVSFTTGLGPVLAPGAGLTNFRARCLAFTGPGHITGTISAGTGPTFNGAGANALLVQTSAAVFSPAVGPSQSTNAATPAILGVGIQAQFDDVAPTAITENNWGNLRISTRRELYMQLRDAAGNERGANVSAANALNVNTTQLNSTTISMDAGGSDAGTQRVILATNSSVIVSDVTPGTGAAKLGKQDSTAFAAGTNVGVAPMGVVDDGTVALPAVGNYTPIRIDPTSHGLITALAAGAAAIGTVGVTSVIPGTGALNLGKAEDQGHVSGDVGIEMLGVRNELGVTFNDNELDYTPVATDRHGVVFTQDPVNFPSSAVLKARDQMDLLIYTQQMIALCGGGTDSYRETFARGFELR